MRQVLKVHPDSRCPAVTDIEVEVSRPSPDSLLLHYLVAGKTGDLHLPPVTTPGRADGLWQRTCFEAFVRAEPDTAYYEFNFSPSTQWAAYRFSGYRSGMSIANVISAPRLEVKSNGEGYQLQATLALDRLRDLPSDKPWRLGLSAVIEETSGGKSYWALAHPAGKADFHHADCFTQELPVAVRL